MALKGTLKDFGIAEILQLIGQQAKSGVLHLESRDDVIHIAMADGSVVRAESAGRKAREKLGSAAGARRDHHASSSSSTRSTSRSGRCAGSATSWSSSGTSPWQQLREMTALQTTETVYKLFHWKSGTYAFEPGDVEWDPETVTPLRAESVLMEGFRQVDEWPLVRKKIPSAAMTFERLRSRARPRSSAAPTSPTARRGPARDGGGRPADWRWANERRVYELAVPGRTVERIVDLSRLGEFETCKALQNLVNLGYLRPCRAPAAPRPRAVGAYARTWQDRLRSWRGPRRSPRVAIAVALAAAGSWAGQRAAGCGPGGAARPVGDNGAARFLARYQLARLRGGAGGLPAGERRVPGPARRRWSRPGWRGRGTSATPGARPYHYRRQPEGALRAPRRRWSEARASARRTIAQSPSRRARSRIDFPDNDRVRALCGVHNEHLKLIERRLGVQLGLRGGQLVVAGGDAARVALAERLLRELYELLEEGFPLHLEDVDQATKLAGQGVALREVFGDTVFVSARHRVITPKGLAQKRYVAGHPRPRHRLRHRPGRHRQDLPGHGHGGGRPGGAAR